MTIDAIYTAESTAIGGGRDGHVKSSDGKLDLDTRPPKEMGGSGDGVNPELLFSAGYAACFLGALRLVAKNSGVTLDDATAVTVRIGIGKDDTSYGLTSEIAGFLPGLEKAQAEKLMAQANQVCPYSKATRGNVEATLVTKV
jgi:Ohr subfamily peroxiredoxin